MHIESITYDTSLIQEWPWYFSDAPRTFDTFISDVLSKVSVISLPWIRDYTTNNTDVKCQNDDVTTKPINSADVTSQEDAIKDNESAKFMDPYDPTKSALVDLSKIYVLKKDIHEKLKKMETERENVMEKTEGFIALESDKNFEDNMELSNSKILMQEEDSESGTEVAEDESSTSDGVKEKKNKRKQKRKASQSLEREDFELKRSKKAKKTEKKKLKTQGDKEHRNQRKKNRKKKFKKPQFEPAHMTKVKSNPNKKRKKKKKNALLK